MSKKTFNETASINNTTYVNYINRLKLIAMSLFKWDGLPETCDSRFLEDTLFEFGRAVFIKDDNLGYMNLKAVPSGYLNVYNLPVKVTAFSINYSKQYDMDKCVLIMNNKLQMPTMETIQLFARRLYEVERTIDVNIKAQNTPVLISGSDKQRLTLMNLYMKYDGNYPFIFGDNSAGLNESISSIKTDAPYLADKLQDYKHEIWNECLTALGINNANTDKKERLITGEVESNDDVISINLNTFYEMRKIACEQINKMFNLKVSVTINRDIQELLEKMLPDPIEDNKDKEVDIDE